MVRTPHVRAASDYYVVDDCDSKQGVTKLDSLNLRYTQHEGRSLLQRFSLAKSLRTAICHNVVARIEPISCV